jgi:hypothetical protein
MTKNKLIIPFYSIAFWVYPIITLLKTNLGQVNPLVVIRPFIFLFLLGLVVLILFWFVYHSFQQAALLTLWWGILFSSYGHLYFKIEDLSISGLVIGRHRFLLTIWILLALMGIWLVKKLPARMDALTIFLNLDAVVLLLIPLFQIGVYFYNQPKNIVTTQTNLPAVPVASTTTANLPDVYYIVLDSYGRKDLLEDIYRYDDSSFLSFLKSKGFYIAECSQSNYNHTWFSISSALNMDYTAQKPGRNSESHPSLKIKNSLLRETLEKLGYQMTAFDTGYDFIDLSDAKYYFHQGQSWELATMTSAPINSFELMFMRTTIISPILEINGISEDKIEQINKQQMMDFIYSHLQNVPDLPGPKFIYAHINTTHPPYFFRQSAEQREAENKIDPAVAKLGGQTRLYRDSLVYSDPKVEKVIDAILAKSKVPPIIIVQGDHAPFISNDKQDAFDILNAYFFPKQDYSELYPSISPVNSFRVILNQYFSGSYPILKDQSYYSVSRDSWSFTEVDNQCSASK